MSAHILCRHIFYVVSTGCELGFFGLKLVFLGWYEKVITNVSLFGFSEKLKKLKFLTDITLNQKK